jgi:hypothetical protein
LVAIFIVASLQFPLNKRFTFCIESTSCPITTEYPERITPQEPKNKKQLPHILSRLGSIPVPVLVSMHNLLLITVLGTPDEKADRERDLERSRNRPEALS